MNIQLPQIHQLIRKHGVSPIIAQLSEYMLPSRRERINNMLKKRVKSVQLAIEAPANPHNAGAALRTAEALGLLDVHVINSQTEAVQQTTVGAFHWLDVYHHNNFEIFLKQLYLGDTLLVGATPHASTTLDELPIDKNICVIFGNEVQGLSAAALSQCNIQFTIPMSGMSESLNLSVAIGICLYDLMKRKRALLGQSGDLTDEELQYATASSYLRSLPQRLITGLYGNLEK